MSVHGLMGGQVASGLTERAGCAVSAMPVGLVTLGDHLADPTTGKRISQPDRFRQFVELGTIAEDLGFDLFHVGEHHFSDYALSSPTPVLAAVAEHTTTLRLSTAVSLLPHHDPVRIAEDYATVDVLSGGRVELIAGRGVYKSHYRQFGQDDADGEALLVEAVTLLRRLWTQEGVTWQGRIRPPLHDATVRPRPVQQPHPPIWLSASSLQSLERAVSLRCPIVIPTVSTGAQLSSELAHRYREQWAEAGLDPAECRVGLHLHLFVGEGSSEEVIKRWKPHQMSYLNWVMSEVRGPGFVLPPALAELGTSEAQAVCGNVETVAEEVARRLASMGGADRLLIQSDQGGLPFDQVRSSLECFAAEVRPRLDVSARL